MKAHRMDLDDPRGFVLIEELDMSCDNQSANAKRRGSERCERRVLSLDDNVYHAQNEWKTNGKFVLISKDLVDGEMIMQVGL